jgi:uncharacterized caspase-like protein
MRLKPAHFFLTSIFIFSISLTASAQNDRSIFAVELTEIGTGKVQSPQFYIGRVDGVNIVKFWIFNPVADKIDWSKIYPKINGKYASKICDDMAASAGKMMLCDLNRLPGYTLDSKRNVFEIEATDWSGTKYYASFVFLTDAKMAAQGGSVQKTEAELAQDVKVEEFPVSTGTDRTCPEITLQTPLQELVTTREIRLRGTARDDKGTIASITVNGQSVTVIQGDTSGRGLGLDKDKTTASIRFEKVIAAGAAMSIIIEVADNSGNRTRYTLPVSNPPPANTNVLRFSGRRFAVVIGVSDYQYNDAGLTDLAFADVDAKAFYDFLISPKGGNFSTDDILFMTNQGATLSAVRLGLESFLTRATKNDLVYFFLAGHGTPDPYDPQNLYFLLYDAKVADLKRTALNMNELKRIIETKLAADRVLFFLDTCHSAGVSKETIITKQSTNVGSNNNKGKRDIGLSNAGNNIINQYAVTQLYNQRGRAVLTSSDVNESSLESTKWGGGHGVFTWALLEGLKGSADSNSDRIIVVNELFEFVKNKVRLETKSKQNPQALAGANSSLELVTLK